MLTKIATRALELALYPSTFVLSHVAQRVFPDITKDPVVIAYLEVQQAASGAPDRGATFGRFSDLFEALQEHADGYAEQWPEDYPTDRDAILAAVSNLIDDHHDGGWVTGIVSADFLDALHAEISAGQPEGEL